jgi:hypothetical protein
LALRRGRHIHSTAWLGIVAHAGFIPLFALNDQPALAAFNALSVVIWISAWLINRRGASTLAMWMLTVMLASGVVLTTFVGLRWLAPTNVALPPALETFKYANLFIPFLMLGLLSRASGRSVVFRARSRSRSESRASCRRRRSLLASRQRTRRSTRARPPVVTAWSSRPDDPLGYQRLRQH